MNRMSFPSAQRGRSGVSLVELLVVVVIIAILLALSTAVVSIAQGFAANLQEEVTSVRASVVRTRSNTVRPDRTRGGYIANQYIVMLADSANPDAVAARWQRTIPVEVVATFSNSIKGLTINVPSSYLATLMSDPEVRFIEQDLMMVPAQQVVPDGVRRVAGFSAGATTNTTRAGDGTGNTITVKTNTPMTGFQQTFVKTTATVVKTKPSIGFPFFSNVNLVTNLATSTTTTTTGPQGSGVVNIGKGNGGVSTIVGINVNLVIVDTGVNKHRDLYIVDDKSQQLSKIVVGSTTYTDVDATNNHGTLMAGIAAALDNNLDVVGAAPGAKIWSCRAVTGALTNEVEPAAAMSRITTAVDTLTQMAKSATTIEDMPHVVYIGFTTTNGLPATGTALNTSINALADAGAVVVVPAGNGGVDAGTIVPANCSRAITVGALVDTNGSANGGGPSLAAPGGTTIVFPTIVGVPYNDETIATFSNRNIGTTFVDLLAPGVEIQSTFGTNTTRRCTGTSAAAAHVAGLAALAMDPNARASQNITNVHSIFNNLGYGTSTTNIPDSVDFLFKNLYPYQNVNEVFTSSTGTLPNSTISGIRVANGRLF